MNTNTFRDSTCTAFLAREAYQELNSPRASFAFFHKKIDCPIPTQIHAGSFKTQDLSRCKALANIERIQKSESLCHPERAHSTKFSKDVLLLEVARRFVNVFQYRILLKIKLPALCPLF